VYLVNQHRRPVISTSQTPDRDDVLGPIIFTPPPVVKVRGASGGAQPPHASTLAEFGPPARI